MIRKIALATYMTLFLCSCGTKTEVDAAKDLPECKTPSGDVVYVKATKTIQVCTADGWKVAGTPTFDKKDNLPTCDEKTNGDTVLVAEENQTYRCKDSNWSANRTIQSYAKKSDFPECKDDKPDIYKKIYFAEDQKKHYLCEKNAWNELKSDGITVTSNQILSSISTDFCTQYSGDDCYFGGGQRVKYSDGSTLVTGQWRLNYLSGGEIDTDENTVTVLVPSGTSSSYQVLSRTVARGSGSRAAFLVYTNSTDTASIYHDTNNDGACCSSDTLLSDITKSNW